MASLKVGGEDGGSDEIECLENVFLSGKSGLDSNVSEFLGVFLGGSSGSNVSEFLGVFLGGSSGGSGRSLIC